MAGVRPFFLTGANAKIIVNGKTLAFCTDLSCSVQVLHQTPKVLGMYEGSSVEPLGYSVSGSFTVIRYVKDIGSAVGGKKPDGTTANDAGNGVGNWGGVWGGKLGDFLARNGVGNDGRANEALDPSKFQAGTTFDIQIYQKVKKGSGNPATPGAVEAFLSGAASILQGGTNSSPGGDVNYDYVGVLNIRNCRITQSDFTLTKKGAAVQRFSFVALYADEDSFVADASGNGQQFG